MEAPMHRYLVEGITIAAISTDSHCSRGKPGSGYHGSNNGGALGVALPHEGIVLELLLEGRSKEWSAAVARIAVVTGGNKGIGFEFAGLDFYQRIEWMFKNVNERIDGARKSVQTDYYGTKRVTEALLNLLQSSSDGRIVNVSSDFGLLRWISNEEVRQDLNDIDNLTEERLAELLDKFLRDFEAGELEANGWPTGFSAYRVAKAAMNAYTRLLARRNPMLRINCAHPGYVKTDMTMGSGVLTTEEGARNVVKVVLLPEGGQTGKYFAKGEESSFM
ncbi:Short-chain dehydrogenase/reductase 2 [Hordeum vulgare]|nr:Short-chain dehydrogenase/reductase 2 [Hordeum vulgare]